MLPDWIKQNLRRREDGHDVIGVTISLSTVKKIVAAAKRFLKKRRKESKTS